MALGHVHRDVVTVATEPAMTSLGSPAGYGLLGAVNVYGHRGLG